MRILHTSDWHLGRSLGSHPLLADQHRALERIVQIVRAERVDLVVVAGDVFDRSVPPNEAVVLLREVLVELKAAGAQVALVAGNHDGADRLAAYDGVLSPELHVAGGYRGAGAVRRLRFADGEVDLVLLPYLDPLLAPEDDWIVDAPPVRVAVHAGSARPRAPHAGVRRRSAIDQQVMLFDPAPVVGVEDESGELVRPSSAADGTVGPVERARPTHASVLTRRVRAARSVTRGRRSVAVLHAFVAGGRSSASERELGVGVIDQLPPSVLRGFGYSALGHLHRAQTAGSETIRYSGTPLAYGFDETEEKSVTIVDLAADGTAYVMTIPLGVCRGVATVAGRLDELLNDPRHVAAERRFVRAIVTDPGAVIEPMARLRARFPHVVELALVPDVPEPAATIRASFSPATARSPYEVTLDFWRAATGLDADAPTAELIAHALSGPGAR